MTFEASAAGVPDSFPKIEQRLSLKSLFPRFAILQWVVLLGLVIDLGGQLVQVWFLRKMRVLIAAYGYGRVPHAELPNGQLVDWLTYTLTFGGYALALAAFLVAMSRALKIAKEAGLTGFEYGFGWTAGSLFVPFWNFSRPWVGFAEIRTAIWMSVENQRRGDWWKSLDASSGATWALGLATILGNLSYVYYAKFGQISVPHGTTAVLDWATSMQTYFFVLSILVIVRLGVFFVYLRTLQTPLLRLIALATQSAE